MMNLDILIAAISQGILWGLMAVGVYLTYRILHIADLTAEGSFPLGAAVAASSIVAGFNAIIATIFAALSGLGAGFVTGILYTKFKIPALIAGILTMTGLYSINLRIMGQANISLLGQSTLFTYFNRLPIAPNFIPIVVGGSVLIIVIFALFLFFKTEVGYILRSTGDNDAMSTAQGVNTNKMRVMGIMIANALVATSGALVAQNNGFADISMGIGTIVIGLASVTIGEVMFGNLSLAKRFSCVVLGSIVYRMIIALAINLNMNPNDLRLISAIILAIVLATPTLKTKLSMRTLGR